MTRDARRWVTYLQDAVDSRQPVSPITVQEPGFDVEDGYAVQDALVAARVASGDRVIGAKLGLTSRAKREQMQVGEPCYGALLGSTVLGPEDAVPLDALIHPRVEPEIVLRIGSRLEGPGVTTADVLAATEAIGCGLEVIDSRYAEFAFALADVVADNTSAARIVLGPRWVAPRDVPDLSLVGCLLEVDGELVTTAAGAAVAGHPAAAVAMLANWLGRRGRAIEAGWLVFTGGLTDAVALAPGRHVTATFGRIGSVTARAA